jgi:hypothetical protein
LALAFAVGLSFLGDARRTCAFFGGFFRTVLVFGGFLRFVLALPLAFFLVAIYSLPSMPPKEKRDYPLVTPVVLLETPRQQKRHAGW